MHALSAVALAILCFAAAPAHAQLPLVLSASDDLEGIVVVPERSPEAVRSDLRRAEAAEADAEEQLPNVRRMRAGLDERLKETEAEQQSHKSLLRQAKKDKATAKIEHMQQELDGATARRAVLQALIEVRDSEVALAEAERTAAQKARAMYDAEVLLVDGRALLAAGGSEKKVAKLEKQVRQSEDAVLAAAMDHASAQAKVDGGRRDLARRRLKLLDRVRRLQALAQ